MTDKRTITDEKRLIDFEKMWNIIDDGEFYCRECGKDDDISCTEYIENCPIWRDLEVPNGAYVDGILVSTSWDVTKETK